MSETKCTRRYCDRAALYSMVVCEDHVVPEAVRILAGDLARVTAERDACVQRAEYSRITETKQVEIDRLRADLAMVANYLSPPELADLARDEIKRLRADLARAKTGRDRSNRELGDVADALPEGDWQPGMCSHAAAVARVVTERDTWKRRAEQAMPIARRWSERWAQALGTDWAHNAQHVDDAATVASWDQPSEELRCETCEVDAATGGTGLCPTCERASPAGGRMTRADFVDCIDRACDYRRAALRLQRVYDNGPLRGEVKHKDLWHAHYRALQRCRRWLDRAAVVAGEELER